MGYDRLNLKTGDKLTEAAFKHVEDGIASAAATADAKQQKGDPGQDGKDGANGKDGKSAYQVAQDAGFEGDQAAWLASLKGKDGKDGANGKDGAAAPKQFTDDEATKLKALVANPPAEG